VQEVPAAEALKLKGNLLELFSVGVLRKNLLILLLVWSYTAFAYYLIPFYVGTIPSNMFLLMLCVAIAEIVGGLLCLCIVKRFNKKRALQMCCAVSCISSIGVMVFKFLYTGTSTLPMALLYLFLDVGVVVSFNLVFVIVVDLFPTLFLSTAYGCGSFLGRVVTIAAPQISRFDEPWPLCVLAVYAGIAAIFPLALTNVKSN